MLAVGPAWQPRPVACACLGGRCKASSTLRAVDVARASLSWASKRAAHCLQAVVRRRAAEAAERQSTSASADGPIRL
eukprot:8002444-Alexandrium_andersonii.AAC.1